MEGSFPIFSIVTTTITGQGIAEKLYRGFTVTPYHCLTIAAILKSPPSSVFGRSLCLQLLALCSVKTFDPFLHNCSGWSAGSINGRTQPALQVVRHVIQKFIRDFAPWD
ncbi:hypothetical protein OS493_032269 [Desmophyllum pertusum]|uniref:Uncharacterized protein n=1 Tax=Desmophyllum pertusum TaxID=174260 RepID=A0A9W9Z873_9CNID|nr:hypothetical protein OS493_032269 [Desmophyllum pertusum]